MYDDSDHPLCMLLNRQHMDTWFLLPLFLDVPLLFLWNFWRGPLKQCCSSILLHLPRVGLLLSSRHPHSRQNRWQYVGGLLSWGDEILLLSVVDMDNEISVFHKVVLAHGMECRIFFRLEFFHLLKSWMFRRQQQHSIASLHHFSSNPDWTYRVEVPPALSAIPFVSDRCKVDLSYSTTSYRKLFVNSGELSVQIAPGLLSASKNRCNLFIVSCAVFVLHEKLCICRIAISCITTTYQCTNRDSLSS